MTQLHHPSSTDEVIRPKSARCLIPNGALIEAYRKAQGWTREEFEWQSHLAVERAAQEDKDDGRFYRRYKLKSAEGKLSGIGTTTLTNIESNKPVYAFTLKIVSQTLGIPVQKLINPQDQPDSSAGQSDSATAMVDRLMHIVQQDSRSLTAQELAQIIRKFLDQLFPLKEDHEPGG